MSFTTHNTFLFFSAILCLVPETLALETLLDRGCYSKFLFLVIAKTEILIVPGSIPPVRNKTGYEIQAGREGITSAAISCSKFGVVLHKLLGWFLQTSVAIFTNFSRDFYKILPRCSQTFASLFTNFCRDFHKLLPHCSQTFAVAFTNFCRVVHKLLP